jgi:hypothetical protein
MAELKRDDVVRPVARLKWMVWVIVALVTTTLSWKIISMDPLPTSAELLSNADKLPDSLEDYRNKLRLPDFGKNSTDSSPYFSYHASKSPIQKAKYKLFDSIGLSGHFGVSTQFIRLISNYSALSGKHVYFARSREWFEMRITNSIFFDGSSLRTRDGSLRVIDNILRTNGMFLLPMNLTNVVLLAEEDLSALGCSIPTTMTATR